MTLHRPSNVDEQEILAPIIRFLLDEVSNDQAILWPIHPRTQKQLQKFGLWEEVLSNEKLILLHPLGYHDMLKLNMEAKIIYSYGEELETEIWVDMGFDYKYISQEINSEIFNVVEFDHFKTQAGLTNNL